MSYKNKNSTVNIADQIISNLGYAAMSIAAVVGLLELHQARAFKLAPAMQAGSSFIADQNQNRVEEMIRREKEENTHSIVSYGTTMRSHPTTGKM